jgi:gamma-glutamyltranspeptidase/glutathione hydrolase
MQTWTLRKPAVRTRHGLVAAQNRHAAEAGAAVLARGGNAVDAAVVTALVLSVVEPWLSGIGGGGFLLHADGATGAIDTLNFNLRSASALDPADYPLVGGSDDNWFDWPAVEGARNVKGYSAICVPGAIAGLAAALERFGTLSWADALQPAIDHAERGLEIDWYASLCIGIEASELAQFPATAELFLDNGRAPRAAERGEPRRRPMPAKARLLKRLAAAGARDFYEGEVAAMLVADLQAGGSRISREDLARYRPEWHAPLKGDYRGWEVNAIPGLSGGPSFLDALSELARDADFGRRAPGEAALGFARAIRRAYDRRLRTMGHAGSKEPSCTTHISVVDENGTLVSLTNTLLSRFGSKVVLPNAGLLMNNGVMWFDPRPGRPNSIAPDARPLANMCPLVLTQGDKRFAIGAAGGRSIFPALTQLVSYVVDFGMSLEEAFHAPRIDASGPTIRVNARAASDVAAAVAREFPVEIVEDTLYPTQFAIPSAALRDGGENVGMAHPTSPWASVAVGAPG